MLLLEKHFTKLSNSLPLIAREKKTNKQLIIWRKEESSINFEVTQS